VDRPGRETVLPGRRRDRIYVSRIADRVEEEQLSSADGLIDEARQLLAARAWTPGELHLLAVELTASLADVRRVAKSRGGRLAALGPASVHT